MNTKTLALVGALIALPVFANAQQTHGEHGGHQPAPVSSDKSASTKAFQSANTKMHRDMDIKYSGNADVDFVRGMIPHHQGAVDMAKIVLQYGKDPEMKKLATDIIKAQESEIAWMTDWLKKNAK